MPCSHPDPHPNLNREVRRSLTWHSSKSESALKRFEPVAVDKLRLDGSLAMFALEGDGCLNRAWREDAGRIHKAGTTLCDFLYFWSYKSTIKEKFLHVSSRVVEGADPCLGDADRVCFANRSIPLQDKSPSISNRQNKKSKSIPLFLLKKKAQKKKLQKRKRRKKISRSAERLPSLGDADTHAPRMCQFPPLSVDDTAF